IELRVDAFERGAQALRIKRSDGLVGDDDGAASPRQMLVAGRRTEQTGPDLDRVAPLAKLHADDRWGVHLSGSPAAPRRCTTSSTRWWNDRPSVVITISAVSRYRGSRSSNIARKRACG